ncbi:biopolymer transport protein ExbB [Abditibacterium utsteinense]|uniref:Biopolymer transport protein ExbB n=1 Tax=Abditibacterium utsteinense TaxID=1960156 RepID=A0A2S8SSK3_9BACT|nr:MotA/TolQ/ExbB proton channel family protein [Abditibacterium utsteinense]PQV63756.1 biopolymer transport protein ExbB [Abditibacterium utsteinense]
MSQWIAAHGGLIGLGVLLAKYSLIVFSILSFAVMIERIWVLRRLQSAESRDFPTLRDTLLLGQTEALPSQIAASPAPCAAILGAGLAHQDDGTLRLREAMSQEVSAQIAALQFNLPILATAATTAPYVGLFGTVLGILAAFREIATSGQTGASVVAGGISEALTATALGLGVAIPAVMAYNYFTGRVNKLALEIETHALDLATRLAACPSAASLPVASQSASQSTKNEGEIDAPR